MLNLNRITYRKITKLSFISNYYQIKYIDNEFLNQPKFLNEKFQSKNYSNNRSNNFNSIFKNNRKLVDQDQIDLTNLGLDKYAKLFEENQLSSGSKGLEEDNLHQVKYFQKFLDEREFKELTVEMYDELIDSDEKREEIKSILKMYELEKYNTSQVPTELTVDDMKELLDFEDNDDRLQHLSFLFKKQARKSSKKLKRNADKVVTENRLKEKFAMSKNRTGLEFDSNGSPIYAKWKNTFFISFNSESLRKESDRRIRDACLFGPRLVIDFDWPPNILPKRGFSSISNQLSFLLAENISASTPFFLNFCGLSKTSELSKYFDQKFSYINQPNCLINVTEKSYLDLYPREDLIYLSSDAEKSLERVDPNKVYIIGCNYDKYDSKPYSLEKARDHKIPAYKLPLEEYFFFKHDRILTINLVFGILCKYFETNDWRKALVNKVPSRKLKTPEELKIEQIRKIQKYQTKKKLLKVYRVDELNNKDRVNQQQLYRPNYNSSFKNFNKDSPLKSIKKPDFK